MTHAVSLGGSPPLTVQFRIESRPMVGSPTKIMIAVQAPPNSSFDHLHGAFTGNDGLTVQSERDFDAPALAPAAPIYREVTVVPGQPGVLSLNTTLLYDVGQHRETSTFSIPLIAQDSSS
jgi:hypothetical protein